MERHLRVRFDSGLGADHAISTLQSAVNVDSTFLDAVDCALAHLTASRSVRLALDSILRETGSVWTVSPVGDKPYLSRRVSEPVAVAVRKVIDAGGRPAEHLKLAWRHTYGRQPEPTASYRESIRAVEAAAKPIVSPNDEKATLGTIMGALKSSPSKFHVALTPTPPLASIDVLRDMCALLWKSQLDRHGTDDTEVPLSVSQQEAEAAVFLAVTLVQWFTSGAVMAAGR